MEQPERGLATNFTQPVWQIILILVTLALVGVGVFFALPKVLPVFQANLYLNGFILGVFVIGLLATIWQVVQVAFSVSWIRSYVELRAGHDPDRPPRLLAPLATLMRERGAQMRIGSASARSILDSVATRIDEQRDITRYITNLLIFLGLLGTFFGLATTVPALVETIRSLAPEDGDTGAEVFERLMSGLDSQLSGMGTAFSSSLLGLAGSLVVGLLELFATHGQNRFYRALEEWLSSITRLGFAPGEGDGGGDATGGWIVHMADQIAAVREMFAQAEGNRAAVDTRLMDLAQAVEGLAAKIYEQDAATPYLIRVAEGQERLLMTLEAQAEAGGAHVDAESRMRLRSIDVQLLRILEEMSAGRQETLGELRGDIAALTKALRQLTGGRA